MSPSYDIRRKPNVCAYALLTMIALFTFLNLVVTCLEFYYLHDMISHINLDSIMEVFKDVKVNDIKSILGKITEKDVEEFFEEIATCITNECYR